MEKIRKFLSRINKNLLTGILCLAAGLAFILASGVFLHVMIRIAGAAVAVVSAIRFVYAIRRYNGPMMTVAIINSMLLLLVGLVMLFKPGGTLQFIYIAIGVYLMINAFIHIYRFALAPKMLHSFAWWTEIITSTLILILGFWLAFSPGEATRITEIIAGISLIIKSVELFCIAIAEMKKSPSEKKRGDVEAEYVDKSHEL